MKYWINFILLFFIVLIFNSCCSCTEMACSSRGVASITLKAGLDDCNKKALEDLLIIQTDQNFKHLDSISRYFFLASASTGYELGFSPDLFDTMRNLPDSIALKAFNYIIVNPALQRRDTIQNIQYEVKPEKRVCNWCSPKILCADEYFTYNNYLNPWIQYNGETVNSFTINY